jgi:GntR family transcriptional repressor for pyruvate dehydrogenase complex
VRQSIPPLKKRPRGVSIELAAHFERLIRAGELPPGTRLPPERELAAAMSVSRTSLREAMHELEGKNLIERRPGLGTVVLDFPAEVNDLGSLTDLGLKARHVMELRETLEPQIAAYAAVRATPADLLQIWDAVQAAHAVDDDEAARVSDAEFHTTLGQAAHNPLFTRLGGLSSQWMTEVRTSMEVRTETWEVSMCEHQRIYDAVAARDPEGASLAMALHLSGVRERLNAHHDLRSDTVLTVISQRR